ncbi:hypothetical protein ABTH81_21360, partial [Acinetobacter baumannii]
DKLRTDDRDKFFVSNTFETSGLAINYPKILSALGNRQLTNISLVKINNETYWQVFSKKSLADSQKQPEKQRTDILKDKMVSPPSTI